MSNENEYDVGYKKPPHNAQFRKGVSGNPCGRPKGARNLNSRLAAALNERVSIVERGKRRTITKFDAVVKQLVNKAASGDVRSTKLLLAMIEASEAKVGMNHIIQIEFVEAIDGQSATSTLPAIGKG